MDSDLELEQAGLPVIQMNHIQQGHNLVRMELRLGRREPALELAAALLAYMERQTVELPYFHAWKPSGLRAVPRDLLEAHDPPDCRRDRGLHRHW
jgi:hypothetical protein